jgi:hypothetical protein
VAGVKGRPGGEIWTVRSIVQEEESHARFGSACSSNSDHHPLSSVYSTTSQAAVHCVVLSSSFSLSRRPSRIFFARMLGTFGTGFSHLHLVTLYVFEAWRAQDSLIRWMAAGCLGECSPSRRSMKEHDTRIRMYRACLVDNVGGWPLVHSHPSERTRD